MMRRHRAVVRPVRSSRGWLGVSTMAAAAAAGYDATAPYARQNAPIIVTT
jgi:hypothetical protein